MKNEIISRIEGAVDPAIHGVSEILNETDIDFQIEVSGTPQEIAELQEVATSIRIPRFLGLSRVTSEIRKGLKREAESSTDSELVYAVIGGESKTLERFSDILSRIEVFKKIISNDISQEELLFQIRNWEETINEIIDSILDPREKEKFQQIVNHKISELTSSPHDSKKDSYQERLKKLVQNPNAIKHLKKYLRPEHGESFSTTLIKEYFETANLINVLNVLRKLEKPVEGNNQFGEKVSVNEINFLETKREVDELFKKIEKIKKSNLSPNEKIEKIRELENYLKNIIIMCGNKILVLFPDDKSIPDIETTALKNVLKNEKAICAGKVEILSAVLEYLGIDYEKVLVPRHTFMDIKLPSGDLMISDLNFRTRESGSVNTFYLLEAEPMDPNLIDDGIQNLPEKLQNRVVRRRDTNGKITYYVSKTEPKLDRQTGDLDNKSSPISISLLANLTFQDQELQTYKNKIFSEFYPRSVRIEPNKPNNNELIYQHTLKLLEKRKINPEVLLNYRFSDLINILSYLKEKNEILFETTLKEIKKYLQVLETKDKNFFYNNTDLPYVGIMISSLQTDKEEEISSVDRFIQSKLWYGNSLEILVDFMVKNKSNIDLIYKLIEYIKNEDSNYYWIDTWQSTYPLRTAYFNLENYQKLSPPAEKSIIDCVEIFEHRRIKEIEDKDGEAFISIVVNLLNKNRLDELFKNEKISQEQKELLIKYLLGKVKLKLLDKNIEKEKLIKLIEVLKSNTSLPDIINQLNDELLQKYEVNESN